MEITIRGKDYRVSPAMEDFATKKLDRLNRYLPNIASIHLELALQRSRHGDNRSTAQITIRHMRGAILRAEESVSGDNMETALNMALDNMGRRIERFKGRRTRKGKTRFSLSIEEWNAAEVIPEDEVETAESSVNGATADAVAVEEEAPIEIIRRKSVAVTTLNEEEAVEQMELLGHNFFMFFNEATGSVSVVYKRRSGGYGVLVPENQPQQ
ncbi:MAG: ribosome-associated translation inhibitor RaiA [Anaerolineae bacterium]